MSTEPKNGEVSNLGKAVTVMETENPFFPVSEFIDKEEFGRLPKKTIFSFRFGMNNQYWVAQFKIDADSVEIAAQFDSDMRANLNARQLKDFAVSGDGKKLTFPKSSESFVGKDKNEIAEDGYYIDDLQPRNLETDINKLDTLSPSKVAQRLESIAGQNILFYTGAGISVGGERPVWGMAQLKEELGLINNGDGFANVFRDPEKFSPADLLAKVSEFKGQLFEDISTPAHMAIADIVKSKKGALVFTENIDNKHEAEGSRLDAVHMDADIDAFTKIKLRSLGAKILLTVGLSADDRAVIQYLKQQNPDLIVMAFVLSENTIPKYLDEKDCVILGDVQVTLPQVAEEMEKVGGNSI